jgi:hypothetical protein
VSEDLLAQGLAAFASDLARLIEAVDTKLAAPAAEPAGQDAGARQAGPSRGR